MIDLDHGIFAWDSFDCLVVRNVIEKCELGLAVVHTSERNVVAHNSFKNNIRPATCDYVTNSWDAGYPKGGNFWYGHQCVDVLSGEDQDLPGSDGICDAPADIPFDNLDRYPLARPPEDGEAE